MAASESTAESGSGNELIQAFFRLVFPAGTS